MIDYRAISAIHAVIELQSFDAAAKKLNITQSAVSQRIQTLENYFGKPALIRAHPYKPTELGTLLLGHYQQLQFLEQSLKHELNQEIHSPKISIAISRDSLETWFAHVMQELKSLGTIKLEIISDDQEVTLDYLRKGLVSACASTQKQAISGCQAKLLGIFEYLLVASPQFAKYYFSNQKVEKSLINAPSVIFDYKDKLHAHYLKKFFKLTDIDFNHHIVPSVSGFKRLAVQGHAYALIPKIDILEELKSGTLVNLFPDKTWQMPVYWHSWIIENKTYKAFNELVFRITQKWLK